jgi:pilus assembly protein Flp/PilA
MRMSCIIRFLDNEAGQDLIEYALVAALLSLCAVASMRGLGGRIANAFNTVTTNLSSNI